MDEVRRFIRYTLPGLACALELLILLGISKYCFNTPDIPLNNINLVGAVFGTFFISGALGYILSIIYFALYWKWPLKNLIAVDHRNLFKESANNNYIKLIRLNNDKKNKTLDKREAWIIIARFWNTIIKADRKFKEINSYNDRLVDITHSIGSTIIGFIFTFILWVVIVFKNIPTLFVVLVFVIWVYLIYLFCRAYWQSHKALQSISNSTIIDYISGQKKTPIEILYSE